MKHFCGGYRYFLGFLTAGSALSSSEVAVRYRVECTFFCNPSSCFAAVQVYKYGFTSINSFDLSFHSKSGILCIATSYSTFSINFAGDLDRLGYRGDPSQRERCCRP